MPALQKTLKITARQDLTSWMNEITQRRSTVGSSVADFKFLKCRVRQLNGPNLFPESTASSKDDPSAVGQGGVLYWMNRDQRVQDNWAFLYAQRLALKFKVPLHACFCLVPRFQADTLRHFTFMVDGLAEVEKECRELNISFHLIRAREIKSTAPSGTKRSLSGTPASEGKYCEEAVATALANLVNRFKFGCVVTDFCPLREPSAWLNKFLTLMPNNVPVCQVDAHNVVPAWLASDKLEYAARTIRRKLHEKSVELWTDFPPLIAHPIEGKASGANIDQPIDWSDVKAKFDGDCQVKPVTWAQGGTTHGFKTLHEFIKKRLHGYNELRNNPTQDVVSDLSPWLHFGNLAPQRALIEVRNARSMHPKSADAFIEETFIRRELADNFCLYNPLYDSIEGAYKWARDTLLTHAKDERNPGYTDAQLEQAKTSDDLWNATQRQLLQTGKIHGFLRMYWAKKILHWHTDGPEAALRVALYLNDRYSLDGTDPNGFVGVMWSICGIHDQGWAERPVFGKIRCMTYKGCQGKFSIPTFVSRYSN